MFDPCANIIGAMPRDRNLEPNEAMLDPKVNSKKLAMFVLW